MKTLTTTIAAIALSFVTTTAYAQSPHAQRGLEKAELHKRMKDKQARKDKEEKGKKTKTSKKDDTHRAGAKGHVEKSKGHPEERGAPGENSKDDRKTDARLGDAKSNEHARNGAKGLDRRQKEERKHLIRNAKISRIAEIAQRNGNDSLLARAGELRIKEQFRYKRALTRLEAELPDVGSLEED